MTTMKRGEEQEAQSLCCQLLCHGAPKDKRALIAVSFVMLLFFLLNFTTASPRPVPDSRLVPAPAPLLELALVSTSTKLGIDGKWMKGTILL
mmetsp:Transcript_17503/g.27445  ORF Transcript_17503/g.27445 Transcript_17503/m.27445 type:complete len:92 (-) Transcript_17503:370-645(-)